MKNVLFLFFICLFISRTVICQTPAWEWIKNPSGMSSEMCWDLEMDNEGNVYIAGVLGTGTVFFDTTALNASDGGIFLAKYDSQSHVLWAKHTSATGTGTTNHYMADPIVVDDSGNVYLSGYFRSAFLVIDTDTLINTDSLNGVDIFLAKFDSNGNYLWAKSNGGHGWEEVYSIAIDNNGNICIGGYFSSSSLVFGSDTIINKNSGYCDIFYAKYDASGNALSARSAGGQGTDDLYSIATDDSGNVFLAGDFDSPYINFGTDTLFNEGALGSDMFIVKYDVNGNVVWAKSAGGNQGDLAFAIATDETGNLYMTGFYYSSYISFDSIILNNPSTNKICIVKFDPDGNVLWAKRAGGNGGDNRPHSIAVDTAGNVYVSGYFYGPIIYFDFTTLTNVNPSGTRSDIFIAKYDTEGNVLWAKGAGGQRDDVASSIALDNSGNIYTAGWFYSPSLAFDSTTIINTNTSGGAMDIFLAKIGKNPVGIDEQYNPLSLWVYPNPTNGSVAIEMLEHTDNAELFVIDISGQQILRQKISNPKTVVNISYLASGIYFLKIINDNGVAVKKIMKE